MTLFDPEPHEDPPDASLPARDPDRLGMGTTSPWQGLPAPSFPEGHDPDTCEVCSPAYAAEAWRRGVAKASRGATFGGESPQPLSPPPPAEPRPALRFPLG